MATYVILNLVIMLVVAGVLWQWRAALSWRYVAVVLVIMLLLTAIFDSLMIVVGIMVYDTSKTLGLFIGLAPIEDFAYAIVAAILAPLIWSKQKGDRT